MKEQVIRSGLVLACALMSSWERNMTFIRKIIAFARTAIASFFEADRHSLPGASDLDFYLFNRDARMDEVLCQKISLRHAGLF